jgi:hypothetical protein
MSAVNDACDQIVRLLSACKWTVTGWNVGNTSGRPSTSSAAPGLSPTAEYRESTSMATKRGSWMQRKNSVPC